MEFKKPIYPIEQWNITETEFKKENNYRNETTFALSTATLAQEELSWRRTIRCGYRSGRKLRQRLL